MQFFAFARLIDVASSLIIDRATFETPHRYATGVEQVVVNGTRVIADGEHTGATPGRVVRDPRLDRVGISPGIDLPQEVAR